jgi:hypothetical protein
VHTPARVAPSPVAYIPTPQLVQLSADEIRTSDQLPAGHIPHCRQAPKNTQNQNKTSFSTQNDRKKPKKVPTALSPLAANRPRGQLEHAADPLTAEIDPYGHARHALIPSSSAKKPAAHSKHALLAFPML